MQLGKIHNYRYYSLVIVQKKSETYFYDSQSKTNMVVKLRTTKLKLMSLNLMSNQMSIMMNMKIYTFLNYLINKWENIN